MVKSCRRSSPSGPKQEIYWRVWVLMCLGNVTLSRRLVHCYRILGSFQDANDLQGPEERATAAGWPRPSGS